jgi:hypothetical protein
MGRDNIPLVGHNTVPAPGAIADQYEVNGSNFMAKKEALLFIIQNAATMSL